MTESITFDFNGKVAIVTGAARGVGRSTVKAFVDAGAKVIAADRDAAGLAETCASLGDTAVEIVADVSTLSGANAIVDAALQHFGRLDICVNNAAVAPHTSLLEERIEGWDTIYAVNCRGTFLMTQAAARKMIAGGRGGRIINFSSGVSRRGSPGTAAYASSRAATESFSRVAAIELAPYHEPAYSQLAAAQEGQGLLDGAEQTLRRAAALAPDSWEAHLALGNFFAMHQRYEPALEAIEQLVAAGELGTVMHVESNFSHDKLAGVDPGDWRASAKDAPVE